ncbi:MAG: methyltransferase domain-containing protein [Candidatus Krumholzibacteria bacterium]|nr:methyltransferase domain-containing protein [Candidatus Krumholzibacteria bacterium]
MVIKPVVKGLLTFIPGVSRILPKGRTGGTNRASYCLEVWLKHLALLRASGMRAIPRTLAELGPGDSIGVGLAALLSGVDRYYALDVVRFSNTVANLAIFDELAALSKARDPSVSDERIARIRGAIASPGSERDGVTIEYMVPWSDIRVLEPESIDVIISHAVLEHVVDLESTYRALALWLKPGGMMSHQMDFTSHRIAEKWNGYRAYPEFLWKAIVGRRTYLINRQPCSVHLDLLEKNGFEIVSTKRVVRTDGIRRSQLARRWRSISDEDLACSDLTVQARKR